MKKQFIKFIGIELEGRWHENNDVVDDLKSDGSIEFGDCRTYCDGDCRDNCDCYNDCECESCAQCVNCDNHPDYCDCDSCLCCMDCNNILDVCECEIEYQKQSNCIDDECVNGNLCTNCMDKSVEIFHDNRNIENNCNLANHVRQYCDYECRCECQCGCNCITRGIGELVSNPLEPKDVEKWINDNYPDYEYPHGHTNDSCGGHFHASFIDDKQSYHILATNEFYNHYMTKIKEWADNYPINQNSRFYRRWNGNNSYCKNEFNAISQIKLTNKESERYSAINYCYSLHNTIEIRLLPVFQKKEIYISAIKESMKIINEYLMNHKPKTITLNLEVKL